MKRFHLYAINQTTLKGHELSCGSFDSMNAVKSAIKAEKSIQTRGYTLFKIFDVELIEKTIIKI